VLSGYTFVRCVSAVNRRAARRQLSERSAIGSILFLSTFRIVAEGYAAEDKTSFTGFAGSECREQVRPEYGRS
jgi:hypothetical protein